MSELKQTMTISELQPLQFEHVFQSIREQLSGTEAEKAAYCQMAQFWFNRGYLFALQSARGRVEVALDEIQQAEKR